MADNYSPTTDGDLDYASDDISSVQWPYSKLAFGADGSVTRVADSDGARLPVAVGTSASSIGKVADAAAGATDTGVAVLAVRDDVLGTISPADGDYASPRLTSRGAAWVSLDASLPAGSNNVGAVDIDSMPAADRLTDNMAVALQTDAIMSDTAVLTPKFAVISAASSGDNTLVAAVTGKVIRVTSLHLVSSGTVSVRFESGAGGTALTGVMPLIAQSILQVPFDPTGHFQTASGVLLNLELSGAVGVYGWLKYVEV